MKDDGQAARDAAVDAARPAAVTDAAGERHDAGGAPQYRDLGNGIVVDDATGLSWQQTASAQDFSWVDSKQHCVALALAGGGWRLPTLRELRTIAISYGPSPAIDANAFPGTPADDFWSSSESSDDPGFAAGVSFQDGSSFAARPGDKHYARCVRDSE